MSSVNRKMAAGIAWMSLMRFAIKGLGLASTVLLARLLVPADFGIVAMAVSIVAALELFSAFNFDVALIQRQDAERADYDTAWTFNVLFGAVLALILVAGSFVAADFYNEPRLTGVMHALAIGVFVLGFENIGVVAFRKDLVFHKEFAMRIAQKVGATAVTLPLAFALRSYWALVIGMVAGNVLAVLISYYAHPFRPRLSLASAGRLFSFSKWLAVNNVLWFLRDRLPDFLLGRISGATALGVYSLSYEISHLPTAEVVAPINRAVLPAYAKMTHDLELLRRGFLDVIGLIALLALPAGFGIAAAAPLIVTVLLGDSWAEAGPIVSVLGLVGALSALQTNCIHVHYALGRPRTTTVVAAVQVAALLPTLFWGVYEAGAIGIAYAYLANNALVSAPLLYFATLRALQLPLRRLVALLWRPAIATGAMYAAVRAATESVTAPSLLALLAVIVTGALTYGAVIVALWLIAGRPVGPEKVTVDQFMVPVWRRVATKIGLVAR
jgi:O-antigen/teichoic acid export membrane protein